MTPPATSTNIDVRFSNVTIDVAGRRIIGCHDGGFSLDIPAGAVVGIVGPNGCGKSTLLSTLYRHNTPTSGSITVRGRNLAALSFKESAQLVAALPQNNPADLDFRVRDLVFQGRYAQQGSSPDKDEELCRHAMELTGIEHLEHRGVLELSGGERQRVLLARALAQDTPILVLDEPSNHLDLRHQLQLLRTLRIISEQGKTVIAAMHDLNAAMEADHAVLLDHGDIVASGPPHNVLSCHAVHRLHAVQPDLATHPLSGAPRLLFDSNHSL